MAATEIHVRLYWDRDEPDGTECVVCGEKCFLAMWRAIASCGNHRQALDIVMCNACHQAVMENREGEHKRKG